SVAPCTAGAVRRCAASLAGATSEATPSTRCPARRFARGGAAVSLEESLRTGALRTPAAARSTRTGAARPPPLGFPALGCVPARAPERCAPGSVDERLAEPAPELVKEPVAVPVTSAEAGKPASKVPAAPATS